MESTNRRSKVSGRMVTEVVRVVRVAVRVVTVAVRGVVTKVVK